MGLNLSSPQLDAGLVSAPGPGAPGPFTSAFYLDPADTNSLGFYATLTFSTYIEAQYTDAASVVRTVTCSTPSATACDFGVVCATGSVLCPVANTNIGTGPVIFTLDGENGVTSAIYVGRTTATVTSDPITATVIIPGQTTYLATETSTIYETTKIVAMTTTLTGEFSATLCPSMPYSSPTTLLTSTRGSSPVNEPLSSSQSSSSESGSDLVPSTSSISSGTIPTSFDVSSSSEISASSKTKSPSDASSTIQASSSVKPSASIRSSSISRSGSSSDSPSSRASSSLQVSSLIPAISSSRSSPASIASSSSKKISTLETSSSAGASSFLKASSSSKTSVSSKLSTSSKSSTSKTSRSTSKSSISTSKSSSIKTSSRTISSSKSISSSKTSTSPICSTGADLKSLSNYPSLASRLCKEVLSTTQTFPASISVWPASRLSSACSCYDKGFSTKVSTPTKIALSKRNRQSAFSTSAIPAAAVASSSTGGFSSSSSFVQDPSGSPTPDTASTLELASASDSSFIYSSSSTATSATTISGFGVPNIYSVPTTTVAVSTETVYITGDPITHSATTATVSSDATTVTTDSTVTVDQRSTPSACTSEATASSSAVTFLSARSLSCTNLKLHTSFLWTMMKNPFNFCAYYLTANRNQSPLAEMSARTLKDTCDCLVAHKSAPLQIFEEGTPYLPKPKRQCNQSVAALIQAKFKEPKAFCTYYTSTSRSVSPFSVLKPRDLFAGCSCLI